MIFLNVLIVILIIASGLMFRKHMKNNSDKVAKHKSAFSYVWGGIGAILIILVIALSIRDFNKDSARRKAFPVMHQNSMQALAIDKHKQVSEFRVLAQLIAVDESSGEIVLFIEKVLTQDNPSMPVSSKTSGITINGNLTLSPQWGQIDGYVNASFIGHRSHGSGGFSTHNGGDHSKNRKSHPFHTVWVNRNENLFTVSRKPRTRINFYSFTTRLHPEDKLTEISSFEMLEKLNLRSYRFQNVGYMGNSPFQILISEIGPSALVFLLGVLLLTQLFTRKEIALPAIMAVVLLFIFGLKSYEFSIQRAVAENTEHSIAERRVAANFCKNSRFFRKTGLDIYEKFLEEVN